LQHARESGQGDSLAIKENLRQIKRQIREVMVAGGRKILLRVGTAEPKPDRSRDNRACQFHRASSPDYLPTRLKLNNSQHRADVEIRQVCAWSASSRIH